MGFSSIRDSFIKARVEARSHKPSKGAKEYARREGGVRLSRKSRADGRGSYVRPILWSGRWPVRPATPRAPHLCLALVLPKKWDQTWLRGEAASPRGVPGERGRSTCAGRRRASRRTDRWLAVE